MYQSLILKKAKSRPVIAIATTAQRITVYTVNTSSSLPVGHLVFFNSVNIFLNIFHIPGRPTLIRTENGGFGDHCFTS